MMAGDTESKNQDTGAHLAASIGDELNRLGCTDIIVEGVASDIAFLHRGLDRLRCGARIALAVLLALPRRCESETAWTALVGIGCRITADRLEDAMREAVERLALHVGARRVCITVAGCGAGLGEG